MSDFSLTARVVQLATTREELAQRMAGVAEKRKAFDATVADELAAIEGTKRRLEAEEAEVRGLALIVAEQTGNKKPAPGVEVVTTKQYDVDEKAAFEWAKVTGMALIPESVDVKAIKKIATVQSLHFVTVSEVPSVRLATDLTKALNDVAYDRSTREAA